MSTKPGAHVPDETADDLYENAPCGYITALPDGRIVRVNRTFLSQIGMERAEVVGKKRFQDLLTLPGQVFYDTHFAPLIMMRGFVKEISCDFRRSKGPPMPALVHAKKVIDTDGQPALVRYMVFEATERRMYEADLLEARRKVERYAAMVESSADAIITLAPDGSILTWNAGARAIFGRESADVLGIKAWELADLTNFDFDGVLERLRSGDAVRLTRELDLIDRRMPMWISATFTPHIEPPGIMTAIFAIIRDITEFRAAEDARQQQELLKSVVKMQEEERNRIARDLHDHVGQQATGIRLALRSLQSSVSDQEQISETIRSIVVQAEEMDRDISLLAFEMRPSALESLVLPRALDVFVTSWSESHGINAEIMFTGSRKRLHPEIETNIYRIAQEALNNIVKHAHANHVSMHLDIGNSELSFIIEDDGCGFDVNVKKAKSMNGKGFGLSGMFERAQVLGGTVTIESATDAGTTIFLKVPVRFA